MLEADHPVPEPFFVGGPEHRAIVLVAYDPTWPQLFEVQKRTIQTALEDRAKSIEHIGSTAVPGLVAKPIIDIAVAVADVDDEPAYLPALERSGYVLRVREPGHRMLRTPELDVHIHVWPVDAVGFRDHVAFRDRLLSSSDDRTLYAATKRRLAQQDWPTVNHYADAKTDVIRVILSRASND